MGDPFASDTEQGPQVDQAQFDKIMSYIDKGKSEGAQCITGGGNGVGDKGYFVQPTIFDGRDRRYGDRHRRNLWAGVERADLR